MRDVPSSISFLDHARINFSLVFPVSDFTIRGKFSRGNPRAHRNLIAICRLRTTTYSSTLVSAYVYLYVRTETCTYLLFTGRG